MKINKIGIIVLIVIIIACSLLVVYSPVEWLKELSSALLGGALLSFFLCAVNHSIYVKECYEKLTMKVYAMSIEEELILKEHENSSDNIDFQRTITKIYLDWGEVYDLNHDLLTGLFKFDPRRKKLKQLNCELEKAVIAIFEIYSFTEAYPIEAAQNLSHMYNDLKEICDTKIILRCYLLLSKQYFSSLHSPEVDNKNDDYIHKAANKYKLKIKPPQQERNKIDK